MVAFPNHFFLVNFVLALRHFFVNNEAISDFAGVGHMQLRCPVVFACTYVVTPNGSLAYKRYGPQVTICKCCHNP